jgi:hypothetical protein
VGLERETVQGFPPTPRPPAMMSLCLLILPLWALLPVNWPPCLLYVLPANRVFRKVGLPGLEPGNSFLLETMAGHLSVSGRSAIPCIRAQFPHRVFLIVRRCLGRVGVPVGVLGVHRTKWFVVLNYSNSHLSYDDSDTTLVPIQLADCVIVLYAVANRARGLGHASKASLQPPSYSSASTRRARL